MNFNQQIKKMGIWMLGATVFLCGCSSNKGKSDQILDAKAPEPVVEISESLASAKDDMDTDDFVSREHSSDAQEMQKNASAQNGENESTEAAKSSQKGKNVQKKSVSGILEVEGEDEGAEVSFVAEDATAGNAQKKTKQQESKASYDTPILPID